MAVDDYRATLFQVGRERNLRHRNDPAAQSDGAVVEHSWIDVDTSMLVKTSVTVDVPPNGDIEQIIEFGDYRTVDGVKVPFAVKSINAIQTATVVLKEIKHNVEVDDAQRLHALDDQQVPADAHRAGEAEQPNGGGDRDGSLLTVDHGATMLGSARVLG